MKKGLVILVLVLAAPLYASTITFVETSPGVIDWTSDVACVAMGLDVDMSAGQVDTIAVDSFFDIFMDVAFEDPCGYTYGYDNGNGPVADQIAAGSIALPQTNFCISMGGLGGEEEPLDDPCMSGTITLTGDGAGELSENALRGGCIDEDGNKMDSNLDPTPLAFVLAGCIASDHPDFAEWDLLGQPPEWCYPNQCYGDADGLSEAAGRATVAVGFDDITVLLDGFGKAYTGEAWIGADFTRTGEAAGRATVRVGFEDIDILLANLGTTPPGDCND